MPRTRRSGLGSRSARLIRSGTGPLLATLGLVALSRVGYYLAGLRYDASSLSWFWQFIDPALLRGKLGQSLWHLHSQPPGFNLFLGLVIKLFPGHEAAVFNLCYLLLGFALAATMFLLLRELGAPDLPNVILTTVYVASPACVLYENWLFYTYPATLVLLLAAWFWQRFVRHGRFWDALLLFTCAAALALTWSLFHLVWLLVLALGLVLFRRRDWRKVVAAVALPLLVVIFWYGKNLVQFGQFTGSTWFGINFSKMTNSMLTPSERRTLYDQGVISAVSLTPPFNALDNYYGAVPQAPTTGIAVLDQENKPSGSPNFNQSTFIAVSRQYGRDALRILASRPDVYLRGLAQSYLIYFLPSSAYLFLADNANQVRCLDRMTSIVFSGRFWYRMDHSLRQTQPGLYYRQGLLNTGWLLIVAYVFLLGFGLVLLLRRSHSGLGFDRSSILFIWLNVVWMTFVANAIEVGENNRFRFTTDPLVFVFTAAAVCAWLKQRSSGSDDQLTRA